IPTYFTRRRTCSGPGSTSGRSSRRMSSAAWMASAFMSVLLRKWWAVPVAGVGVRWADRGAHDVTGEPPRPGRGPRAVRSRGHRDAQWGLGGFDRLLGGGQRAGGDDDAQQLADPVDERVLLGDLLREASAGQQSPGVLGRAARSLGDAAQHRLVGI